MTLENTCGYGRPGYAHVVACVDRSQELNLLERDRARARRKQMGLLASASTAPLEQPQTQHREGQHPNLSIAQSQSKHMRAGCMINPKESVAEPPSAAATAAGDSGSAGGSCSAEIETANETAVMAARDDDNHSGGNGNAGAGDSRLAVAVPSTEGMLRAHDPIGGGRYVAFAIYGCVYNESAMRATICR